MTRPKRSLTVIGDSETVKKYVFTPVLSYAPFFVSRLADKLRQGQQVPQELDGVPRGECRPPVSGPGIAQQGGLITGSGAARGNTYGCCGLVCCSGCWDTQQLQKQEPNQTTNHQSKKRRDETRRDEARRDAVNQPSPAHKYIYPGRIVGKVAVEIR